MDIRRTSISSVPPIVNSSAGPSHTPPAPVPSSQTPPAPSMSPRPFTDRNAEHLFRSQYSPAMQGGSSTAGMHLRTTEPVISGVDSGASGQTPVQGNNDKLELQRFAALFEARKDSIMKVYRSPGELVYHGTTKDNKRRIQEIGFRKTKKTGGATEAAGDVDDGLSNAAGKHHYFSTTRAHAMEYAALAGEENNDGAIVTVFGRTKTLGLKTDTDSAKENRKIALRTNKDISSGYVLPSKKNPDMSHSSAAVEHFQNQLKRRFDIEVPTTVAASWLHDVQSDSEGDDDKIAMTKKIKIR